MRTLLEEHGHAKGQRGRIYHGYPTPEVRIWVLAYVVGAITSLLQPLQPSSSVG